MDFGRSIIEFRFDGRGTTVEGGFEEMDMDEDLVRVWPEDRVLLGGGGFEEELIEASRRWRVTIGGLDRSFLTGSVSGRVEALDSLFDELLCNPPLEGLLELVRDEGGRAEASLLVALGGRTVETLPLEGGFTGSREGDWVALSGRDVVWLSLESVVYDLESLLLISEGFRNDRVREGADMLGCRSSIVLFTMYKK